MSKIGLFAHIIYPRKYSQEILFLLFVFPKHIHFSNSISYTLNNNFYLLHRMLPLVYNPRVINSSLNLYS
jgi:hypothetical protein